MALEYILNIAIHPHMVDQVGIVSLEESILVRNNAFRHVVNVYSSKPPKKRQIEDGRIRSCCISCIRADMEKCQKSLTIDSHYE